MKDLEKVLQLKEQKKLLENALQFTVKFESMTVFDESEHHKEVEVINKTLWKMWKELKDEISEIAK